MIKIRTLASKYEPLRLALTEGGRLKVYRDIAPEGSEMPFLVWSITNSSPISGIDCSGDESEWVLQFDVYAADQEVCDEIAGITIDFINSFGRFKGYVSSPVFVGEYRNTLKAFAIEPT